MSSETPRRFGCATVPFELGSDVLHHRPSVTAFSRTSCLFALMIVACGPPPPEPPHFLWSADVQSLDNPFPDHRFGVDGKVSFRPRWYRPFLPPKALSGKASTYFNKIGTQAARAVTSLSNFGGTLLPVSEPLDPGTLQGSVARLVKAGTGWRVLERAVAVQHPRDSLAARGRALPEGYPEFLDTRPSVPLPEGSDGLLVVLRGPKTLGGVAFGRGAAWGASQPELASVAAALGVPVDDILLTLPEHAGEITAAPRALARWADANPAAVTIPAQGIVADQPNGTRVVGAWRPGDPDWSTITPWLQKHSWARPVTHVGVVIIGELAARDLRENGLIRADWQDNPSLAPVVPLQFVLTLPGGPKPAGGWPVVMGQHGVAGRNTPRVGTLEGYCLEWAEALARRGMGCIGIDAPNHGGRGNFTAFFGIDDLPVLRDRFRQMTFDLLQVERAAITIDADADGVADVAPQLRYFGNSMGAIMGAGFIPVANRISSAVLNVPGGGLSNMVMSVYLQDLIGLLIVAQTDIAFDSDEYLASFPLFRAVAQPFFDPGDPINLASVLSRDVAVLQQTGLNDSLIPTHTSVDLASALGLEEARELSGTDPIHAFVRIDSARYLPAAEAATYNGHNVMWDFPPIREQALEFLKTDGRVLLSP